MRIIILVTMLCVVTGLRTLCVPELKITITAERWKTRSHAERRNEVVCLLSRLTDNEVSLSYSL